MLKSLYVLELNIIRWKVKRKMSLILNSLRNEHFIYIKILIKKNFHLNFFHRTIQEFSFHWKNCSACVLHGELEP